MKAVMVLGIDATFKTCTPSRPDVKSHTAQQFFKALLGILALPDVCDLVLDFCELFLDLSASADT